MKVNLLKKELVVGMIFLLMLATMPHIASNDLPFITAYTDDLVVTVTTNKNKYDIGEPVELTINVTNNGYEDVTLIFPDTQLADFVVKNEENETIYLWSHDKLFYQVITYVTIPSGETVEFLNDIWHQKDNDGEQVPEGIYKIDGWVVEGYTHSEMHGEPIWIMIGYYSPKPEFDIDYRTWYFGKLWFDIKNVGDEEAINVSWRIRIEIITAPPSKPPTWEGIIENLSIGEVERISSDWFIFGLGIDEISIKLNATNSEEFTRITRGFFLGPFIWIPKWL